LTDEAQALLEALPSSGAVPRERCTEHPAVVWARSGAMPLAGRADEAPRLAPAPLAVRADAVCDAIRALAPGARLAFDGAALLGERAAYLGLARRGDVSPGGACRLLRAADAWIAVSLPREDDRALVPAWLEDEEAGGAWDRIAARVAERKADELVARARLIGLAAARAAARAGSAPWLRVAMRGAPRPAAASGAPLVLDLSALWAGPLCGRLLALAGARVVKVESTARPDGARFGSVPFYEALNAEKASVALDLGTRAGVDRLRRLVDRADVVIESARPRALAQLGVSAEEAVGARRGLVWVSVTGYGRPEPEGGWIAFGDDAAAAAGLAAATGDEEAPLFGGDAIADPLAGAHAALAALAHLRAGEGALLEVTLHGVVSHALAAGAAPDGARVEAAEGGFAVVAGSARAPVAEPRAALPRGPARPLGADTASVLAELAGGC
jgi:hypothetical protein